MRTQDVTFEAGQGRPMRAAWAAPDDGATHPGVLVLHEIFGLNDDIRRITGRFADLGYAALAPDLYDCGAPRVFCIARTMLAVGRGRGRVFDDIGAARVFLQRQPSVDPSRIGVAGFCMGAGFALLYAVRAPVGAAAVFYGAVPDSAEKLAGVCPVLGGYGARDRVFASQGERLSDLLEKLGIDHDVKTYDGAGHSFMSHHTGLVSRLGAWSPMKAGYDATAAEDSWRRLEGFFARHLAA